MHVYVISISLHIYISYANKQTHTFQYLLKYVYIFVVGICLWVYPGWTRCGFSRHVGPRVPQELDIIWALFRVTCERPPAVETHVRVMTPTSRVRNTAECV